MGGQNRSYFKKGIEMSTPAVVLADANIFLRFLRNDHPTHSVAARTLMEAAAQGSVTFRVLEVVVVDIFYTLTAPRMGVARPLGARQLASLLQQPGMDVQDRTRILEILTICETKNIDYCDAALIVEARREKFPILSYDRDFAKAPDVAALSPIEWIKKHQPK
jgi:predicted nucleic acid-binding protein